MNRIYKTVWNEALAAWVAVQETAKSHGKSASSGVGGVGTVVLDRSGIKKAQRFAPAVIVSALALAAGQANAAPGIYINDGQDVNCNAFPDSSNTVTYAIQPGIATPISTPLQGIGGVWVPPTTYFGLSSSYNPCNSRTNVASEARDTQTNRTLFYGDNNGAASATNNGSKNLTLGGRLDVNSGIIGLGDRGVNGSGGTDSIRIGSGQTLLDANKQRNTLAIGVDTKATVMDAVSIGAGAEASDASKQGKVTAVGYTAKATAAHATALGAFTEAKKDGGAAIGYQAKATGVGSVAVGRESYSGTGTKAGAAVADYTTAAGFRAEATGYGAVSFGSGAKATVKDAAALGHDASASLENSVALGNGSTTKVNASAVTSTTIGSITYSGFAGATNVAAGDQVSVGAAGAERQIKHVAPGAITAISTDAVNGSQLYSVVNGLGFGVNADNNSLKTHQLGKELAIVAGNTTEATSTNNLKTSVTQDVGTGKTIVTVSMKEAPTFTSVTTQDAAGNKTVTNAGGVTITQASGNPVSLTKNGLNNGGNTITGVTDGNIAANSKEAVNGSQLHALKENGFKISDGTTTDTVKLEETVKYLGDGNIVTTVTDNQVGFKLADSITVGPAAGGSRVTINGNAGTVTGLTNKTWNPAAITSGRAATEDQLKAAQAAATSKVEAGDGIAVTSTVDNTTGSTTYKVAADTTALSIGDGTGGNPAGKVIAPATADKNKLVNAGDIANAINNSGFTLTAQNANGSQVNPGETVDLSNTDGNIIVKKTAANNNVTFDLASTVKIGPAAGGSPITINGTDGTISGLKGNLPATTNSTTNQTAPANAAAISGNAATVGDVLNAGWNLQSNGTAVDFVKPYDTVNFADGAGTTVTTQTTGAGTTVKVNVNAQNIAETAQLPVVYTQADGSKVYKHTDGKFYTGPNGTGTEVAAANVIASMQSAAGSTTTPTKLANVAAGTANTDAVNVSQLKGAADALGGGAAINTDGTFKAPSYTITKTDGTSYTAADNVGTALSNLNAEVVKPITFAGDSGADSARKLGEKLTIKGGVTDANKLTDNNIGVVSDGQGTLTAKLAKDIDLGDNGSVKTGDTKMDNSGITIAAPTPTDPANTVSLTKDGLNNGGNKITNVANGTADTDAVNKGQLDTAINNVSTVANKGWEIGKGDATAVGTVKPGKKVDFVAGNTNTKVDVTQDATSGNSKVTVSAAPGALQYTDTNNAAGSNTPNADQFTPTNQVTLVGPVGSTGGITINNVAPAELSATSKQAVNGSQLHALGSSTAAALGGTSSFSPTTGQVTAGLKVGGTNYTNVQDALNAVNVTAGAGWNIQANGGATTTIGGASGQSGVNVVNGSNTNVTLTGNTLKVDVVNNPTFSGMVTANGGLTVGAGTTVNMGNNVITNVADGVADTDAVNVRQLNAVSGGINNVTKLVGENFTNPDGTKALDVYDVAGQTMTEHTDVISALNQVKREGTKYSHTRDNGEAPILGPTNDSSAGALGSTAQGVNAIVDAEAINGTAIGRRAHVRKAKGIAIGNEAVAGGESAIAVGDGTQALANRAISIGTGNVVRGENSGAIGDPTIINAANSYSVGNNNTIAAGSHDAFVLGNNVTATAANSVHLGSGAAAQTAATPQTAGMTTYNVGIVNGVAYNYAGGTPTGVVTVGDVGQERRIQNVAAGQVSPTSTDAINGSQLYQTTMAINSGISTTINNLSNKIDANHDKAMGGVASAMASAGLPQAYVPGKSMVAMGAATYQGRTAMALGVSTISDNGRWVLKGSVNTHNHGTLGANVGMGYQW